MRTGLLARKVGSSRVFREDGGHTPVTLLQVDSCHVVSHRTQKVHGYNALQLGAGEGRPNRMTKAARGHFAKSEVGPKARLAEFRISSDAFVDVGAELTADHFVTGQCVDVTGRAIGKGFSGAMKRHNFSGLRATHGVSVSHRSHGSTGHCQEPGKVFKGKKMAGHLGDARVTVQNLEIVSIDGGAGLIVLKGAVPGANGGWVRVTDAVKVQLPENIPFPTATGPKSETKLDPEDSAQMDAAIDDASAESAPSNGSDDSGEGKRGDK